MDNRRGMKLKLMIAWMAVMVMVSFWLTVRLDSEPVRLAVVPQVPREGEPIIATFKLSNPLSETVNTEYSFYANGELMKQGVTTMLPESSKLYQYTYRNPLDLGEQVHFMVVVASPQGVYEKTVSIPAYPPQIWSSFVSFASFSTSMMGFMSTMTYYQATFGNDMGINIGVMAVAVLIGMLIFLEVTQPIVKNKTIAVLGRLRVRFSTVTWILFMIFLGITYTKVVVALVT
ncbi:hypothetical protein ACFLUE_02955 [Chloroflexota bacterium]